MKPNDSTTLINPESESLHVWCLKMALLDSQLVRLILNVVLGNDPAGEGLLKRFLFSYVQNEALFSHNQYLRASIIMHDE